MSSISFVRSIAWRAIMISMILTAVSPGPARAAKICKDWGFVGQATGPNETQAKALARANWAAKVTDHWGAQWAQWDLASSRWQRCDPVRRQIHCVANGVPCRPGLGLSQ